MRMCIVYRHICSKACMHHVSVVNYFFLYDNVVDCARDLKMYFQLQPSVSPPAVRLVGHQRVEQIDYFDFTARIYRKDPISSSILVTYHFP